MNTEDRGYSDSVRSEIIVTEKDEKEKKFNIKTKLPSLNGKLSPFMYNNNYKDYAHLSLTSPNTGRSISSNYEQQSEVRHLNDGLSVDTRKKLPGFTSDTEEWSATLRRDQDLEEGKNDFTFHEHDDEGGDTNRIASIAIVENEKILKTKKNKRVKTGDSGSNERVDSHGNEGLEPKSKKDGATKKKKKTKTLEELDLKALAQRKTSEDLALSKSPEEPPKKKKSKKAGTIGKKKGKKEKTQHPEVTRQLSTEKSLEIMINPLRNLSLASHGTPGQDHKGIMLTESLSFISSPQSTMALNRDMSVKGDDEVRSESCSSPVGPGPSPFKIAFDNKKIGKKDKKDKKNKKDKKGKKDKMKMYKLDGNSDEKPKKVKEKNPKHHHHHHHHHHSHKPRTNCKKTKLLIVLFTFTILWSIVLNGLEFAFVTSTSCKISIETGITYLCFAIMTVLKFLSVSLFNLELTFQQPYKRSTCLLYSLLIQIFAPLLQIPQNIYDFHTCKSANQIVSINDSWEFLQATMGTVIGILLYIVIRKRTNIEVVKSRIGNLISKSFKCLVILAAIGWNIILIVVFVAQKEVFLPSFFFDFYLYIVLVFSTAILYRAKRKLGEEGLKEWFVKDDKQLNEPLNRIKTDEEKAKEKDHLSSPEIVIHDKENEAEKEKVKGKVNEIVKEEVKEIIKVKEKVKEKEKIKLKMIEEFKEEEKPEKMHIFDKIERLERIKKIDQIQAIEIKIAHK